MKKCNKIERNGVSNIKESLKLTTLGFTLVELLAVIVILAIILVIAVPQIMNTIKDATKASLESSAKMVASQVENQYTVAKTLGKEFKDTGSCMEEWAGLNDTDYASCTYEIVDKEAKVTLVGKGKFKGLKVVDGTRNSATAVEIEDNGDNLGNGGSVGEEQEQEGYATFITYDEDWNVIGEVTLTWDELKKSENGEKYAYDASKITDDNIGEMAFFGSYYLESIIIPNSITSIGYAAFSGCESLTSVIIPNSVTSINSLSFERCSSLESIVIPNSVTSIESSAFFGCESLTSVIIPSGVISIKDFAFKGCSKLTNVEIPNSVKSIGDDVFRDCSKLTTVTIGSGITNISSGAFDGCRKLESISLTASVTSIESYAFRSCISLNTINFDGIEEEWSKISIGDYNDAIAYATINYKPN